MSGRNVLSVADFVRSSMHNLLVVVYNFVQISLQVLRHMEGSAWNAVAVALYRAPGKVRLKCF